jgi:2-C-methyl-D-erythritol 2,4-cyclodiphosphate synthase
VEIPFDKHLVGHSDADVLLHAITDALLGAASLGDIGDLFPDTDEENRDRCSADMLAIAYGNVVDAGYVVSNLDCIVFAERPKLTDHKQTIQKRISEILNIAIGQRRVRGRGDRVPRIGRIV